MFHLAKPIAIVVSALLLTACSGIFWTDNIVTSDMKQEVKEIYNSGERISTAPADVSLLRAGDDLIMEKHGDNIVVKSKLPLYGTITYGNGKTIKGDGKRFVYYEGVFANPLPVTTPSGERYLLDFRKYAQKQKQDGYDGKIYLLKPNGKPYMNDGRPKGVGYFKMD